MDIPTFVATTVGRSNKPQPTHTQVTFTIGVEEARALKKAFEEGKKARIVIED